ncbi:hypothetical protein QYE76_002970 [Lolium multiflorum]|uniref:HTH OST-type domain-containing protein n=1 Tax=Lolium multiflorum TaxID=4521 RepID=A0AAD8RNH7_LOLMU|nr:hypothetical protein QYE76_002970 [Lolium multiflorum]
MSPQLLLRRVAGAGARRQVRGHHRRPLSSASGADHYGGEMRGAPQHGEESKAVKVSVWWDFENCAVPQNVNVCRVAQRVSAALRAAGVRGPLSITAFGDVQQLSRATQEALAATGVAISHVPSSGKNSSDRSFLADLVYWVAQNPPPAHFFLISGDKDFANILYRLRMSNYNILLASPGNRTTSVLCNAATVMWRWEALVRGENFSPKRFNHPPDGLSGSWYGHYRGALDDPFVEAESEETVATPVPSDSKLCRKTKIPVKAIPQHVVNIIQNVLKSYPDGVRLSVLLETLRKRNVRLDSDYFGHKKFSCLLQSMPDIVKVIPPTEPHEYEPSAFRVNKRLQEPAEQSLNPLSSAEIDVNDNNLDQATHNDKQPPSFVSTSFPEQNCETLSSQQSVVGERSFKQTVDENPVASAVSSSPQDVLPEDQQECPAADMNAQTKLPANHVELDASRTPSSLGVEGTVNSDGLLKRILVLWNGPESAKREVSPCHEGTSAEVFDLQTPHQDHSTDQCSRLLNRTEEMGTLKSAPSVLQNSKPCSGSTSVPLCKTGGDTSKMSKGLFSWLTGWWKTEKSDADNRTINKSVTDEANTDMTDESESLKASTCGSEQQVVNKIFTKFYFWDVLGKHLSKPLASEVVSKAKTREELINGLQKLECWPLNGLAEKDLNQLVHLLVSEKKWIEETPSNYFPFRVTLPQKRTCVPSNSSKFDLSTLFSNGKPLERGKYAGDKGRTNRSLTREEVLSDCHKLLKDLLLEHKHGFNISIFKLQFAQKNGYELDHKKLGYADIESLLQIMPGVTVKFPRVVRAENGKGQDSSKDGGNQCNGDDFIWEELGPVSGTSKTAEGVDEETCYQPPNHSKDEFSDNENQADQRARTGQNSLLSIIDSWNRSSSKGDGSSMTPEEIDGLVDCSRSSPGYVDTLKAARQPQKQYSFVSSDSEGEGENKDKLVESVLGSLQKARGVKLPN